MPRFLDTRGNATLGIGICDRCKIKVPLGFLVADGNSPGLRVCPDGCRDPINPWRLPPRPPDRLTLDHPRPDVPLYPFQPIPQYVDTIFGSVPVGLYNDGGVLGVLPGFGWPMDSSGAPGSVWSNGGVASVVPGSFPDPMLGAPVFFGTIGATALLNLGGGTLPTNPSSLTAGQLWNHGGEIWIA